jgi:hypothetical protein
MRPYTAQDAPGPLGRELPGHPAGNEVSQEPVKAVERPGALGHQVNKRLSESRRSVSEGASESTAAIRSLREAASAVARASRPSFLRALPLESTRTRAESLGCSRPPRTRRPLPASPPDAYRGHRRSPSPNVARGTVSPSARGLSSRRGSAGRTHARRVRRRPRRLRRRRPTFCGDRLRSRPSCARTSVSVGPPPAACAKDIPTSGSASIPLLSHSARHGHRREASREQANPPLVGDRKFASDPYVTGTLEA